MTVFQAPTTELPAEGEVGVVGIGPLRLENGCVIDDVSIAVQRWGELSPARDNVVVVLHALTGDSHVTGPAGPGHPTPGWWDSVVGPGAPIDTGRWCAVATNVLGGCRGSTGPSSQAPDGKPWGSRFPIITVRDQVEADVAALAALGIGEVAAVIGGSMGGARALEWIVGHPDTVRAALVLAVGARATADQIGTQCAQVAAIKADPNWQGGDYYGTGTEPIDGMDVARRFAHLTYRGEVELDTRFANQGQAAEDPRTAAGTRCRATSNIRAPSWSTGSTRAAMWCSPTHCPVTTSAGAGAVCRRRCATARCPWSSAASPPIGSTRCACRRNWPSCCPVAPA